MIPFEDTLEHGDHGGTFSATMCIVSSALAGLGIGFFSCLLSSADHKRAANDGEHTKYSKRRHTIGVVGSTIFGVFSLVGLIFGSVSLAVVVRASSALPANAVFSQVFHLRPLVRDDILGTLVTISGIVCFTLFQGAEVYHHSVAEFEERLCRVASVVWLVVVNLLLMAVLVWLRLHPVDRSLAESPARAFAVATVSACASAFMDLATKAWSAVLKSGVASTPGSGLFWVALVINVAFLLVMRSSMIYGSRCCDVLVFVPLNTIGNILFSVATGMFCLQEADGVTSWTGLVFAAVSIISGVLMLVSGPVDAGSLAVYEDEPKPPPTVSAVAAICPQVGSQEEAAADVLESASAPQPELVVRTAPRVHTRTVSHNELARAASQVGELASVASHVVLSSLNDRHTMFFRRRGRAQAFVQKFMHRGPRRQDASSSGVDAAGSSESDAGSSSSSSSSFSAVLR